MRASVWLVGLLVIILVGCQRDESYPERPIQLICPWSPGGGTDRVAREVAALLERELGVPVNVINATGGSGVTGHTRGALAPPDGYTMTIITVELNMLHWRGLTSITYHDFEPVIMLNKDDAAVFVRDDAPWRSLQELQDDIENRPRQLKASGTAQGGIWHVSLAGWLDAEGLKPDDVIWISINGAGPSLQELLSGGVEMVCCSVPEAQTLLDSGRVRCLGVMADERLDAYPDVPTFKEQGAKWSMGGWRGLGLPAGVPEERVEMLVEATDRVARSEEFQQFIERSGFNLTIEPPSEFQETLAQFDEQLGAILTSAAFQSVQRSRYGPYLFPYTLLGLIGAVFVALLVRRGWQPTGERLVFTQAGLTRAGLAVGWIVVYVLVSQYAGFIITSTVLLAGLMLWLGVRWPVAVGVVVVLVPLTYQVFAVGLRVPLPWGWLGW